MSPLLRPERAQHLVARGYRALETVVGGAAARRLSRVHPALEDEGAYQAWLAGPGAARAARLPGRGPLVSLLMPVFDAPERFLRAAIGSLRAQTYPDWELCAADAGPAGSPGSRALAELAGADGRIRVLALERNLGIAGNSNVALDAARGAYVATLDQDDLLAPHALAAMTDLLDREPELDVAYSDMDNVTPWGERYAPFFKPDWSPELLLSANYLAHLSLVRRTLAVAARFDPSLDGAQDWDLMLRVTAGTSRVGHVPEVLYHWRSLPTSCASSLDAKPYAREAQRRTVQAALERRSLAARAELAADGTMQLRAGTSSSAAGDIVRIADPRLPPQDESLWRELAAWAADPQIGAAGALLRAPGGVVLSAGLVHSESATLSLFAGSPGTRWSPLGWPQWLRNVTAPVPAAYAIRRELHERGSAAGLRCVTVPAATIVCPPELAPPTVVHGGGAGLGFSPNLDPTSPIPRPR